MWMEIDRWDPNLIKDSEDITIYNTKFQEQRLFYLLTAVDEKFKTIQRELLKKTHFHWLKPCMRLSGGRKIK